MNVQWQFVSVHSRSTSELRTETCDMSR